MECYRSLLLINKLKEVSLGLCKSLYCPLFEYLIDLEASFNSDLSRWRHPTALFGDSPRDTTQSSLSSMETNGLTTHCQSPDSIMHPVHQAASMLDLLKRRPKRVSEALSPLTWSTSSVTVPSQLNLPTLNPRLPTLNLFWAKTSVALPRLFKDWLSKIKKRRTKPSASLPDRTLLTRATLQNEDRHSVTKVWYGKVNEDEVIVWAE